ncbi:MAG: hypothetical protein R3B70_06860 [Polyangiaceae bacterium]
MDLTLRHVSRQFPVDFARAMLPAGVQVTAATWLDTQITSRQRRLDRALQIMVDGGRRIEHTEWQLEWAPDLPFRIHEYHNLLAAVLAADASLAPATLIAAADRALVAPIRSTVVLLSGREQPWPAEGSYRTSPEGAPFSGVTFRIDAVYQRTVAELLARDSPLWLVFAPLAVDAGPDAMKHAIAKLRESTPPREFHELAVAMIVMADVDRRRRQLRRAILPLLSEDTVMQNWIYKQGEEKGYKQGEASGYKQGEEKGAERALVTTLRGVFVRRAGRPPSEDEERALANRAHELTADALVDVIDMPREAFLRWVTSS